MLNFKLAVFKYECVGGSYFAFFHSIERTGAEEIA